jgi:hypothetical protein
MKGYGEGVDGDEFRSESAEEGKCAIKGSFAPRCYFLGFRSVQRCSGSFSGGSDACADAV